MKPKLRIWDEGRVTLARRRLLENMLSDDDYTIRLATAECTLEHLGYARGRDGRWRKKITAAEVLQMQAIRELGIAATGEKV